MRTMHLLLGNAEQLLTNFIEVLVQDACADKATVRTTGVRTVEALILEGLTGRFDLGIIIPKNLIPDSASTRIYNPFSEAAQAIRILKQRCSMPILVAAALEGGAIEAQFLREAGADGIVGLPFHPEQLASTIRELITLQGQQRIQKKRKVTRWLSGGFGAMSRWIPARAT